MVGQTVHLAKILEDAEVLKQKLPIPIVKLSGNFSSRCEASLSRQRQENLIYLTEA